MSQDLQNVFKQLKKTVMDINLVERSWLITCKTLNQN